MINAQDSVYNNLRKVKKLKVKTIQPEHLLVEDLGLDSMNMVSVFTNISEELELDLLEFDDLDLANLQSVGQLVALFNKQQQKSLQ
jgi:acyl carrier protein